MAELHTYAQLRRRTPLRAVPSGPATVIDFAEARAAVAARKQARADRPSKLAPVPGARPAGKPDPGFPPKVRAVLLARAGGVCELAGWDVVECLGPLDTHHRQPVNMGGTTDPGVHVPSNGVVPCRAHHGYVHRHPLLSKGLGLIIPRGVQRPAVTSVSFDGGKTRRYLRDDGRYARRAPAGGDAA